MSDEHPHCLCCLGETQVVARCSICHSFPTRTHEARELRLRKHLMEEAMRLRAHHEVALLDSREHPAASAVGASPAKMTLAALTKTHCAHKKHSHWHKGGSPRRTCSKCCIASPSPDQLGEKLRAGSSGRAPKQAKMDQKTKHIEEPEASTATGAPLEPMGLL